MRGRLDSQSVLFLIVASFSFLRSFVGFSAFRLGHACVHLFGRFLI
jgi:hypothetical protein